MAYNSLLFDESGQAVEDGETAFRRIAARKLTERKVPKEQIEKRVEILLRTDMKRWHIVFEEQP